MLETILCILKGDFIIGEDCDKIEASYKSNVHDLQSQIDDLKNQLKDAEAKAVHLQAAVENLRGDLSVSNGSRDRAHIKIRAAIKALQS